MMPFPACINLPLGPNHSIDGCVQFLKSIPPSCRSHVPFSCLSLRSLISLLFFVFKEYPLFYSPLRIHIILYFSFPLLIVDLPPILRPPGRLVIFAHLSTIKQRQTEKSVALPHSLSPLLSNENSSQPSRPDNKPSESNVAFVTALRDPTPLIRSRRSVHRTGSRTGSVDDAHRELCRPVVRTLREVR